MSAVNEAVTVWSIKCPCDCGEFLAMGDGRSEMAMPVFTSNFEARRFFTEWAKGKLPKKRIKALALKLIDRVEPDRIPDDRPILCSEGCVHRWDEWYMAVSAEGN